MMEMDSNKVLVKLYVPRIEEQYDVWIPINKKIYDVILLLIKAIQEFKGDMFKPKRFPTLYNRLTSEPYDMNSYVGDTDIKNSSEIILI